MVFKRRNTRNWATILLDTVYPRGGWRRAIEYVRLRLRRLPGSPEYIARGIAVGIFVTFTPFFGLHMLLAAALAIPMRGSMLAAVLATFFGNPITFVPIGILALNIGNFILGGGNNLDVLQQGVGRKFLNAWVDIWHNFLAMFTQAKTDWTALIRFWDDVFLPYLIGGIGPGLIVAGITYYLSVPVIRVYQNRRRGQLTKKLAELREKAIASTKRDTSQS